MQEIREIEELKESGKKYEEIGLNRAFYYAYMNTKMADAELLDFDDVIWDYDIEPVIESLKKYGIKEFTVSSTYSGVTNTLAQLQEAGCRVVGLIKINSRHMDYIENKREMKSAFKLILNR